MAETELRTAVVCDAGPLIHLDELGCLDLLADFAAVLVPDRVWAEVGHHRPSALVQADVCLSRVEVPQVDEPRFQVLVRAYSLDAGEQAALALAREHPHAILLTDDAAARLAAEQLGMRVHGTLGVLLRSIRRGQRTPEEVVALLEQLPQESTLHIRPELLRAATSRVRHDYDLDD